MNEDFEKCLYKVRTHFNETQIQQIIFNTQKVESFNIFKIESWKCYKLKFLHFT